MQPRSPTQNILDIVKIHLSREPKTRQAPLKKIAQKFFPNRSRGQKLENDIVNLLLRHFYIELAASPTIHFTLHTSDREIRQYYNEIVDKLALRFGISCNTVIKYIEQSGPKEDLRKDQNNKKGEEHKEYVIDRVVEELQNNKPQFYTNVLQYFRERDPGFSYSTARRRFIEWGGSLENLVSTEYLKTREYVQVNKKKFLQDVNELLKQNLDIIFLDESYVYEKTMSSFSLTIGDVHVEKPVGKGKRTVLFGALGRNGWVGKTTRFRYNLSLTKNDDSHRSGSIAYWVANKRGDYHLNFNQELFIDIFEHHVLDKLRDPTIIILDRAPYHVCWDRENDFFPGKAKKKELLDWLLENTDDEDLAEEYTKMKKDELLEAALNIWEIPLTIIEKMAEDAGHKVLFLPQYHPEYNAIEYAWAFVKGYARRNPPNSMDDLLTNILPDAFDLLTEEKANNICNHVLKRYVADYRALNLSGEQMVNEEEENLEDYQGDEYPLGLEIITEKN